MLFDFVDWTITLRELIFSVFIIGMLTVVGFLIDTRIESNVNNSNMKYRQAPDILTDSEFQHGIKTNIGDAFVNGKFESVDSVSYGKVDGEYLFIRITEQEYRMHTVHYTTTDNKGHVHHHTRHYWSWDTINSTSKNAKKVKYCGVEFDYDKFSYLFIGSNSTIIDTGFNLREIIETIPTNFNASVFGTLKNKSILGKPELHECSAVALRNHYIVEHASMVFWIVWSIFILFVVVGFFVIDNVWLENEN